MTQRPVAIDWTALDAVSARVRPTPEETVIEYAAILKNGEDLPPVDVFEIGAQAIVLADGFRRVAAEIKSKSGRLRAIVHEGSLDDARAFACRANRAHGDRLTPDDYRAMVEAAVEWWPEAVSDRALAAAVGVNHETVKKYRPLKGNPDVATVATFDSGPKRQKRRGKDGKLYSASRSKPVGKAGDGPAPRRGKEEPAPAAPAADGSIEEARVGVTEYLAALDAARRVALRVLGVQGQQITAPWMKGFSYVGTVAQLKTMMHDAKRAMPVGGTAANPITAHVQELKDKRNA